ncbi:type I restriction endonuclease [Bacillus sp. REN16]|uniref:type I restriction endonuclease n=1 Tax=Bacillus sp. REN16 TaxID=2887296 RepID=UPI001E4D9FF3|nr:type I restriction endonuclease [Bacillus sp. REN16]MCC3358195.1 type I restriction enzyme HsdR N-terminal domain-containing protein [Bacillus sp. REN16]
MVNNSNNNRGVNVREDFKQQIKGLGSRIDRIKGNIQTEEATKTSLIMPLIQALGYDIFNPEELVPEFVADVGIKKGEKIDYAILQANEPVILIEAKSVNEHLTKHDSQLFRYFGTTKAKFAILTNGIEYKFFTDLEEQNKMDQKPFFVINMLDFKDIDIIELAKFRKSDFDVENVLTTASELKYTGEIKKYLTQQWEDPSDDFIKLILNEIYQGVKTKKVIDNFRELVKKSLNQFVNEKVNDKLQKALNSSSENSESVNTVTTGEVVNEEIESDDTKTPENEIHTTEEEIEGYVLVKLILKEEIDPTRVFYRDNKSYFNVLLDDTIRKWVCRLGFNGSNKYIQLNDSNRTYYKIESVNDILNYKNEILEVARQFDKIAVK